MNHLTIHSVKKGYKWNHIKMWFFTPVRTKSHVGILCCDADAVFYWTNMLWVVFCCVACVCFSGHHNTLEWLKWKRLTSHFDTNPELSLTFSTVSCSRTGHTVGVFLFLYLFLSSYSHWHKHSVDLLCSVSEAVEPKGMNVSPGVQSEEMRRWLFANSPFIWYPLPKGDTSTSKSTG